MQYIADAEVGSAKMVPCCDAGLARARWKRFCHSDLLAWDLQSGENPMHVHALVAAVLSL